MNIADIKLYILTKFANRVLWREPEMRQKLQDRCVNIVPSNFYSDVPSIEDIQSSFEYREPSAPVYNKIFDHDKMQTLCEVLQKYSLEFDPPMEGDRANPEGFFWNNPAFSRLDAMSYYCMIRHFKPKRILEIGSGFSTLVADAAIRANGFGEIVSIEPYPMAFLHKIESVTKIIEEKVQDIPLEFMVNLVEESGIWFIDSTHTVKIGSDCLYIYLKIMPEVKTKVVVHTHDIYLPLGMPQHRALNEHIYWTEQYLLYAFILGNPNAEVIFGSCYTYKFMRKMADSLLHERGIGSSGASLWYMLNE